MGVASHSYGKLGGEWVDVEVGRHAVQSQAGLVSYMEMLEYFRVQCEDTADTRLHRLSGAHIGVGSSWNWSVIRGWP